MGLEQLEGIANVTYTTSATDTLILDETDWKAGTLTKTQTDLFSDTLTIGKGNQVNSPSFFTRLDAGSGDHIDVSGNNNDAVGRGSGATWTGQTFRGKQRLEFDGSTNATAYVDFGDIVEAEASGDFTLEVWYYYDSGIRSLSTNQNSSLWNKTYGGGSFPESTPWYLSRVGSTNGLSGNYTEAEVFFRNGGDDFGNQNGTTTDTWRHHAVRYDSSASDCEVYLNGNLQFTVSGISGQTWGGHGGSFIVGMHVGEAFPGTLANVRFTKSYLAPSDFDYITVGTASGYSLSYGGVRTWSDLDFSSISVPTNTEATCDLESFDGGVSQGTLSVTLNDGVTNYDISSLPDGDEIQADFTLDVLNNVSATPQVQAPVEITSA